MFPRDRNSMHTGPRKSLVQIQKQMLMKILGASDSAPSWKILVFDWHNRSIISSHLKMKDLRDHNITLYLSISQYRQQIHGVTILYLVQPTIQNVDSIANDLLNDMYTSVHIHFSSKPSPNILSNLAKKLTQSKRSSLITRISKIQYSCVSFFSIDNSMAILPTEAQIINLITSLSLNPIFIYNPKNEESKVLIQKIKNQLQSIQNEVEENSQSISNNYATFYIFNRQNDSFPMLAHGITYASLMENIYRINKHANRVHFDNKTGKDKKVGELSLQDEIWVEKKNFLISEMGLEKESNRIKAKMMGKSNEQLSQMAQKSNKIEWHVNNAGEMIMEAKQRRLIQFYDLQKQIYCKGLLSKDSRRDATILLKQAPNAEDKTRLMMILILFMENLDDLPELQAAFPDIKKVGKYNQMKQKRLRGVVEQSATNKYLKKFAKGIWKNLVADDKKFNLTKELQRVKNADFSQMIDAGLAVEAIKGSLPKNIRISRNIVYSLGGVCFHQYANIIEYDPDCIYCGDKMVSYRDVL